ncbi:MAG: TraR/DksA C4-type zinc finger protein [Parvularcula sp.]|jgi:DnaK suppressor protein|nr:TraR/DksA C4-type zinc finger protein [Parvularcula sp.]
MMQDLAVLRARLIARREELLAEDLISSEGRAPVTLDQDSVGRLSRIDAMQLQEMALAQARRRKTERGAIDTALQRIEDGEYGYCVKCGEEVAPARLENSPSVTTCITCASEG